MLNDICQPCCPLPKTLFQDSPVHADPDVPIRTQIIATVYQKITLTVWKMKIPAYIDIDSKIMHVII